jgi:hypothetical protein
MPRLKKRGKLRTGFSDAMRDELLSGVLGGLDHFDDPDWQPGRSIFESPLIARATWIAYKDVVMAEARPLTRPDAWWKFEAKQPWPGGNEAEVLERLGVLTPLEVGLLTAQRQDEAEQAAAWQRSVDEYAATKHARTEIVTVPLAAQS